MGDAAATSTDQPLTPHSPACPPEACTWRPQVRLATSPPVPCQSVPPLPARPPAACFTLPQVEQRPTPGAARPSQPAAALPGGACRRHSGGGGDRDRQH